MYSYYTTLVIWKSSGSLCVEHCRDILLEFYAELKINYIEARKFRRRPIWTYARAINACEHAQLVQKGSNWSFSQTSSGRAKVVVPAPRTLEQRLRGSLAAWWCTTNLPSSSVRWGSRICRRHCVAHAVLCWRRGASCERWRAEERGDCRTRWEHTRRDSPMEGNISSEPSLV